jgi:predicted nucleic acid-binding protein
VILVDSSVWIEYFRGTPSAETDRLDALLSRRRLAIGDLILAEVLQGFDSKRELGQARKLLTSLVIFDLCGRDVAIQAAKNFQKLRAFGITARKTIDTIIATHCILHGLSLLHCDRDFDPFVDYLGLRSAIKPLH